MDADVIWPVAEPSPRHFSDAQRLEASWLTALLLFLLLAGIAPPATLVRSLPFPRGSCNPAHHRQTPCCASWTAARPTVSQQQLPWLQALLLLDLWGCGVLWRLHCLLQRTAHQQRVAEGRAPTLWQGMRALAAAARTPAGSTFLLTGCSLAHLRLSAVDRDFGADDYDALLALDDPAGNPPGGGPVTDADLARLPQRVHSAACAAGSTCAVCLEGFGKASRVRVLPCRHAFCPGCIDPWLRQQGKNAPCPICKRPAFRPAAEV